MSAATDDPTGVPIPKVGTYISHREAQEWQAEIEGLESMMSDPKARIEDRGELAIQLRRAKYALDTESPPDVTPEQRDKLSREEKELRQKISENLCSAEEMRKSPPGAIGKHFKEREFIPLHLRWKNIQRILHKGDPNPDISNIEMLRPATSTLNMDNAHIPGKDYYIPPNTQAWKDGYDRTFGNGDAPADSEQVAALQAKLAELEARVMNMGAAPEPVPEKPKGKNLVQAKCGRWCKGNAGKLAHERHCDKCYPPEEQGE
jgi:hypothetical protein